LANRPIQRRDNAPTATQTNNLEHVESSWFQNLASGDLRLTGAAKPAIDHGVPLEGFRDDLDSRSRPYGAGWDIGASEFDARPVTGASSVPYPQSTLITGITWHWETLKSAALGSDLWPVTWGPDDHLYAAWGDGGGFGGSDSDRRVAMGFARIEGGPEHWRGFNINGGKNPEFAASFPKKGKTTGIAFVDGVLYATVNLEDGTWPDVNHVLAWSTNLGANWT
jgi:hypothetical protein